MDSDYRMPYKKEKGFTLGVIPNQLTKQTIPETTPESIYKRKN